MAKGTFKISDLPQIQTIDDADLLLVSDYDNGSCFSRKMTIQQLVQRLVSAIATDPQIMQQLKNEAAKTAEEVAGDITAEHVENIVQQNPNIILDLLDGIKDGQLVIGDDE